MRPSLRALPCWYRKTIFLMFLELPWNLSRKNRRAVYSTVRVEAFKRNEIKALGLRA